MNDTVLLKLKVIVERAVRPVRASVAQKMKMQEELLAHVIAVFEEELPRCSDETAALLQVEKRFGEPNELSRKLQESVPLWDHCTFLVELFGEFFRDWRRKLGALSLVIVFLLGGAWAKSRSRFDEIALPLGDGAILIQSMASGIDFCRMTKPINPPKMRWISVPLSELKVKRVEPKENLSNLDPWDDHEIEWRWDWAGFHFGAGHLGTRHELDFMFPYWSIIVPLTLISLWLLLSKPHKSTQEKIA